MNFKNFNQSNNSHINATKRLIEFLKNKNYTCTPFGYETDPEFKSTKEYRESVPEHVRYKPDIKVTSPSGKIFYLEIKSREVLEPWKKQLLLNRKITEKYDVSIEIHSIEAGLHYENTYFACIHLDNQPIFLIRCIDATTPKEIIISSDKTDQISDCKIKYPNAKIIQQKPSPLKGNGNAYIWAEKQNGITLEQLLMEMN
jgi:hypothetical protein